MRLGKFFSAFFCSAVYNLDSGHLGERHRRGSPLARSADVTGGTCFFMLDFKVAPQNETRRSSRYVRCLSSLQRRRVDLCFGDTNRFGI